MTSYDSVIVGGGFFGLYLSEYLAKQGLSVLLCEAESDVMLRASYVNQARVHNGYHYPRSVLTALRSRIAFPRFTTEFRDCVDDTFQKYYMIGNILGKVTATQFVKFCNRIGAPCELAPPKISKLTDPRMVEAVFSTVEYAFDAEKIKERMLDRIRKAGVTLRLNTTVCSLERQNDVLSVRMAETGVHDQGECISTNHVFNCTYSQINQINRNSTLPLIPLKHEMTEMCLVEVPDELKNSGITIMCGPFFSVMPFPARKLHSFSHVRYTPHFEWRDGAAPPPFSKQGLSQGKFPSPCDSSWNKMQRDAVQYMPILSECRYRESIWEIKTILPRSETDDSRPILFKQNHGLQGYHCIMGGKIDNVYDVAAVLENERVVPCPTDQIPMFSYPSSEYSKMPKSA